MERKKKKHGQKLPVPRNIPEVPLAVLWTMLLYAIGILAVSALLYYELLSDAWANQLLLVNDFLASFGASTAALKVFSGKRRVFKTALAQLLFWGILTLSGLLLGEGDIVLPTALLSLGMVSLGLLAALLLFPQRKRKKFQKNADRRLKKD